MHFRHFLSLSMVLLLTACGFQLRGSASLPPEMTKTYLQIDDEYGPFARRLKDLLRQNGVDFVEQQNATAILRVPVNKVTREVLTIGDNARVREYRITHAVQFSLVDAQGNTLIPDQTLKQAREISFDEQAILAASREQEYLQQDLVKTLSLMMVTRLGSFGS
jgi:LPS-assembly lipoprotein